MALASIARLLKDTMGLDAASIGESAVERAVRDRQHACQLADVGLYWEHLRRSGAELQALIEAVVVPETWFFRDRDAFSALTRFVRQERFGVNRTLRLLSLPCATGEEPLSMAMALFDAGLTAQRFRIDAVDISERVLARARDGLYGRGSFRGPDQTFRDRYFEPTAQKHRIRADVQQQVTFQQGNLLSPAFLPGAEIYDVIFCRNVLIYFDRDTQDKVVAVLWRLLAADGVLFVGSSEAGIFLNRNFESLNTPMAFAFRKARPGAAAAPAASVPKKPPIARLFMRASSGQDLARPRKTAPSAPASPVQAAPPPRTAERGLAEAAALANQGHFIEAALRCEEDLRVRGPSADAFHLLGLVRDASGSHAEAAECYRKALYLDPYHHEALIHLALLMDKLDRKSEADVLRSRVRRLPRQDAR
jgi:chemotaxis protein methyltransferase WspC